MLKKHLIHKNDVGGWNYDLDTTTVMSMCSYSACGCLLVHSFIFRTAYYVKLHI